MNDFDDFEEDDFDQEEFERISKIRQKKNLKTIQAIIAAHYDERTKTVGDKILVWDSSRLTDKKSGEMVYDHRIHSILSTFHSIVIEDQVKHNIEVNTLVGDFSKNLDLVIWNKQLDRVFRTSSDFVKLHNVQ
jgi:hypothetical protein